MAQARLVLEIAAGIGSERVPDVAQSQAASTLELRGFTQRGDRAKAPCDNKNPSGNEAYSLRKQIAKRKAVKELTAQIGYFQRARFSLLKTLNRQEARKASA